MGKLIDMTGQAFGRLTVLYRDIEREKRRTKNNKQAYWKCKCECGNKTTVMGTSLRNGDTKSCGCLHKELLSERRKKHNEYDLDGDYGIGYTSKGEEFYFDKEDYNLIKEYCWMLRDDGYLDAKLCDGTDNRELLHRMIMNCPKKIVDHINGIKHDCRKSNLRLVNNTQNSMNRAISSNNTSGVTGVKWVNKNNNWESGIRLYGEYIYLGAYDDFDEAVKARKEAEDKYFGEYSHDNSRNICGDKA